MPLCVAGVVELADTLDLGSSAERLGGSNPLARIIEKATNTLLIKLFFGADDEHENATIAIGVKYGKWRAHTPSQRGSNSVSLERRYFYLFFLEYDGFSRY